MNYRTNSAVLLIVSLLAIAPHASHAAESYDNCTGFVTSVPAVISAPGTWCLNKSLYTAAASGNAISINSNNVILDCNGFTLSGLAAGRGTKARGISAVNRLNATIRHCNIRGFQYGVSLSGASGGGHVVEDNRFDSNAHVGLLVVGDGSVVQRNLVLDTGGSTEVEFAQGIYALYAVDVLDNTVSGVMGSGSGVGSVYGIYTNQNSGGSIKGNRVRGVLKGGTGLARGIYAYAGRIIMDGNDVVGDASDGSLGLYCASASSRAKNNIVSGFATGMKNCGDAGSNDFTP